MAQSGWETFKLSELRLDEKNYRLGEQDGQRAAILEMINDQKGKLANLARDIMQMGGLSPGEPLWVTKDTKHRGQYIVLEGNRRVTALKLMETPELADGTIVEKHFRNLSKLYAKKPVRQLEARVFASREDAQPWIRRRHLSETSGVGLQRWKPLAKARADKAHGLNTPRFLAVIELLGNESDEWNAIYDSLDTRWTTVDRVLNAKAMADILGVMFDLKKNVVKFENGDTAGGRKLLLRILKEMSSPDFEFADVEKVEDREAFVQRFSDDAVKSKGKSKTRESQDSARKTESKDPTSATTNTAASGTTRTSASKDHDKRLTLAPKTGSRVLKVDGARLQSLYSECKTIKLSKNRNAAALLLRVFIELSSEALLIRRKVPIPSKYNQKKWSDIGLKLDLKVKTVVHYFDPKGTEKAFQQARVALDASSANAIFSIPTLHGYFHNLDMLPDPSALRSAWDSWESYLRAIHDDLRKS